jgi:hypothetical protein
LSGITQFRSGTPFGMSSGRDNSLTGVGQDRPDLVGDPYMSSDRPRGERIAQFFQPASFQQNATGKFGNFGRNVMSGPGMASTDMALLKDFRLFRDKNYLEFRAEFFNAFNRVNLSNPVGTLTDRNVGTIRSSGDPRVVQFGLKLVF